MSGFAVVGHVEWVDFLRVSHVPSPGEIVQASEAWAETAGGGAVAAVQLAKLAGTATFFTAFGNDDHGRRAAAELRAHGVEVEAVVRDRPQRRAVALLDARGERTIAVLGERLVPSGPTSCRGGASPRWTASTSPAGIRRRCGPRARCRDARRHAPRRRALEGSDVTLDALVRSAGDVGERDDRPQPGWSARLTVDTRGADGGTYAATDGRAGSFAAAPLPGPVVDAYGAGDSFAAGLTFALGSGMDVDAALALAARCGAGNLTGRRALRRSADRGRARPVTAMAAIGLHRGMAAISPSGEQIELALGDQRAVVVEVGGGLRAYSAGGRDVLDGYSDDEMCPSGRGQVLSPWPNRVEDGSYEFGGRRHQLALDQPDERNAIHGLVRWSRWRVAQREPHRVVMEHVLHPQPGYPFPLALGIEYGLTERGLEVRTTATNVGSETCPYGTGAHPYFAAGPAARRRRGTARAGAHRVALRRARHPDRRVAGRGHRARLPPAPADR